MSDHRPIRRLTSAPALMALKISLEGDPTVTWDSSRGRYSFLYRKPFNRHQERDMTDHQLKCLMAVAMQTARDAIASTEPRSDALEAALSSLNIVLKFEADHWIEGARVTALAHA